MSDNFVITIARGYGSGGRTIGQMIAKDMDIPFYDRELLYMASEESGINIELFGKMDEKVRKGFLTLSTDKYTGDLIPPESGDFVSNKNLFNYQAKIIKEVAEKSSCVIVGRCADFILRDNPNAVDIFIWAPMADCIKSIQQREPLLSEKEAEREIKKIDTHRSEYYKYYSCREWKDFKNYDLCINSSALGNERTAKFIENYVSIKLGG